jgi:hypothetical protein
MNNINIGGIMGLIAVQRKEQIRSLCHPLNILDISNIFSFFMVVWQLIGDVYNCLDLVGLEKFPVHRCVATSKKHAAKYLFPNFRLFHFLCIALVHRLITLALFLACLLVARLAFLEFFGDGWGLRDVGCGGFLVLILDPRVAFVPVVCLGNNNHCKRRGERRGRGRWWKIERKRYYTSIYICQIRQYPFFLSPF